MVLLVLDITTWVTVPLVAIPVVPFQLLLQSFWMVKPVAEGAVPAVAPVMAGNAAIAGEPVPQVGQ